MRKFLFVLIVALAAASCQSGKDSYTIKGTIGGVESGQVFLQKFENGNVIDLDTAELVNGAFVMKGSIESPEMTFLRLNEQDYFAQFFLENAKITVAANKDSLQNSKVTGSPSNDLFQVYMDEIERLNNEVQKLQEEYSNALSTGNMDVVDRIRIDLQAMNDNMVVYAKNFVRQNAQSPVSAFVFLWHLARNTPASEMDSIAAMFPENSKSVYVQQIREAAEEARAVVEREARTAVGALAPEFTMNDQNGNPVSLSSFKGKYTLLDFWAAWCGPCRRENPHVVKLYNQYHAKGFEVLGISLDRTREDWLKAIEEDKLTWTQVSDLQYWQNEVAQLYGVNSIPHTVLLDPEGRIIAKNLRGDELANKLAEIFQN